MNYKPVLAIIVLLVFLTAVATAIGLLLFQMGIIN
jgi:hypothetical protein